MVHNSVSGRVHKGEGEVMVVCNSRVLRGSLGSVLLAGFIWFILVGIFSHQARQMTTITVPSTGILPIENERHRLHRDHDLNYVSKRRVPNGPDPIHNRKSRDSMQRPDRA